MMFFCSEICASCRCAAGRKVNLPPARSRLLSHEWEALGGGFQMANSVKTDLTLTDALRLSWLLYGVNRVETMSMIVVIEGWTTPHRAQVLLPREAELQALVARWRQ